MLRTLVAAIGAICLAITLVLFPRASVPDAEAANVAVTQMRISLVNFVAATDAAREQGSRTAFDAAIRALQTDRGALAEALKPLAVENIATRDEALDGNLTTLIESATAYANGAADIGAGAAAYDGVDRELGLIEQSARIAPARLNAAADASRQRASVLGALGAAILGAAGALTFAESRRGKRAQIQRDALAHLAEESPVVFFRADDRGRLAFVSPQVERLLGIPAEAMLGRRLEDALVLSESAEPFTPGAHATVFQDWIDPTGKTCNIAISGLIRADGRGFDRGWLRDCSDDAEQLRQLQESEARLREVLDHTEHGVAVIGVNGQILLHNRPLAQLLGYEPQELEALTFGQLVRAEDTDRVMSLLSVRLWSSVASGSQELTFIRRDGEPVDVEVLLGTFRHGESDAALIAEIRDLGARRRVADVMRRMQETDVLTGLPNRETFRHFLDDEIIRAGEQGSKAGVFLVDVDRFQLVNDMFGHASGDQLLRRIADVIRTAMPSQHVVSRFGGNEFLVLMPAFRSLKNAEAVADRILRAVREPMQHDGRDIRLSVSVGLSFAPDHSTSSDDLFRQAAAATHAAKRDGGDRFATFDPASEGSSRERLTLHSRLRRAIEVDEFELHYQPQIDFKTGEIRAVEALVRWRDPEVGLIFPNDFIGALEETGDILPLSAIVLRRACREAGAWKAAGIQNVRMCVNLSSRDLLGDGLLDLVQSILDENGLDPAELELEITETAATLNEQRAIEVTQSLHNLGVRIAIDDFGTGHSSLERLNEFPVHVLKVDRSFVNALSEASHGALPILKSIVAVGHALGLEVVAEGVETEIQSHVLRGIGCDLGQGYLWAKPLMPAQMTAMLLQGPRALNRLAVA